MDWIAAPRGYGADVYKVSIFFTMCQRPQQITMHECSCFFFDLHKQRFNQRYFVSTRALPTLNLFQEDACAFLYRHQHHPEFIEQACTILRNVLSDERVDMHDWDEIDGAFLTCFPAIINEIYSVRGLTLPDISYYHYHEVPSLATLPDNTDVPANTLFSGWGDTFIPLDERADE